MRLACITVLCVSACFCFVQGETIKVELEHEGNVIHGVLASEASRPHVYSYAARIVVGSSPLVSFKGSLASGEVLRLLLGEWLQGPNSTGALPPSPTGRWWVHCLPAMLSEANGASATVSGASDELLTVAFGSCPGSSAFPFLGPAAGFPSPLRFAVRLSLPAPLFAIQPDSRLFPPVSPAAVPAISVPAPLTAFVFRDDDDRSACFPTPSLDWAVGSADGVNPRRMASHRTNLTFQLFKRLVSQGKGDPRDDYVRVVRLPYKEKIPDHHSDCDFSASGRGAVYGEPWHAVHWDARAFSVKATFAHGGRFVLCMATGEPGVFARLMADLYVTGPGEWVTTPVRPVQHADVTVHIFGYGVGSFSGDDLPDAELDPYVEPASLSLDADFFPSQPANESQLISIVPGDPLSTRCHANMWLRSARALPLLSAAVFSDVTYSNEHSVCWHAGPSGTLDGWVRLPRTFTIEPATVIDNLFLTKHCSHQGDDAACVLNTSVVGENFAVLKANLQGGVHLVLDDPSPGLVVTTNTFVKSLHVNAGILSRSGAFFLSVTDRVSIGPEMPGGGGGQIPVPVNKSIVLDAWLILVGQEEPNAFLVRQACHLSPAGGVEVQQGLTMFSGSNPSFLRHPAIPVYFFVLPMQLWNRGETAFATTEGNGTTRVIEVRLANEGTISVGPGQSLILAGAVHHAQGGDFRVESPASVFVEASSLSVESTWHVYPGSSLVFAPGSEHTFLHSEVRSVGGLGGTVDEQSPVSWRNASVCVDKEATRSVHVVTSEDPSEANVVFRGRVILEGGSIEGNLRVTFDSCFLNLSRTVRFNTSHVAFLSGSASVSVWESSPTDGFPGVAAKIDSYHVYWNVDDFRITTGYLPPPFSIFAFSASSHVHLAGMGQPINDEVERSTNGTPATNSSELSVSTAAVEFKGEVDVWVFELDANACEAVELRIPFNVQVYQGIIRYRGSVNFGGGGKWESGDRVIPSSNKDDLSSVIAVLFPGLSFGPTLSQLSCGGSDALCSLTFSDGMFELTSTATSSLFGEEFGRIAVSNARMLVSHGVTIAAPLHILSGGSVEVLTSDVSFATNVSVEAGGTLSADPKTRVLVGGSLSVRGAILVAAMARTGCHNAPIDAKNVVFADEASIRCTSPTEFEDGQYHLLLRYRELAVSNVYELLPQNCVIGSEDLYSLRMFQHDNLLRVQIVTNSGNAAVLTMCAVLCVMTVTGLMVPLVSQHGLRGLVRNIFEKPPAVVSLGFDEFRRFLPNRVVFEFAIFEMLWLASAMFHPLIPLPYILSCMQEPIRDVFLLKGVTGSYFITVYALVVFLTIAWAILWLPLLPRVSKLAASMMGRLRWTNPSLVSTLLGWHRHFAAAGYFMFIPLAVTLMQPFDCYADLASGEVRMKILPDLVCWDSYGHKALLILSSVMAAALCMLVAYSGSNLVLPFGHPPYRADLDLRHKRTFEVVRTAMIFLHVSASTLFAQDLFAYLGAVTAVQSLYLAFSFVSHPCAYDNVNRFRVVGQFIPLWGLLTCWGSIAVNGPYPLPNCKMQAIWFFVFWLLGMVEGSAVYLYVLDRTRPNGSALEGQVLKRYQLLKSIARERRMCRRQQFHDTATHLADGVGSGEIGSQQLATPTDTGSNVAGRACSSNGETVQRLTMAKLGLQYARELVAYRSFKERYLHRYYLGTTPRAGSEDSEGAETSPDGIALASMVAEEMMTMEMDDFDEFAGWVKGQLLGRGSYGSVYIGVLKRGDLAAVKCIELRTESALRPKELDKVRQEIQFIRTLTHPNIIQYKGCSYDAKESCIFIFMEYAVGGSLTSLVRKCKELLSESVIRLYMLQVLRGLEYLHQQGVMHRDIKGENVLLDVRGTAKLADFGCARQLKQSKLCDTQIGSPYWMAPEVIKEGCSYGTEADIWSVGCTVVEILNGGQAPWKQDFETVFAAMYHISHSDEAPNNIPDDVSDICRSFLSNCFVRDPQQRSSAKELLTHAWVADFRSYEPRTRDFVTRKVQEDQRQLTDVQTILLTGVERSVVASTPFSTRTFDDTCE